MNKFPYIGENRHGVIMLILSRSKAVILSDVNKGKTHSIPDSKENPSTWFERKYKNITAEYLANTYGKVESKEHAEFIVKLAEGAGFKLKGYTSNSGYFYAWKIDDGALFFSFCKDEKVASNNGEKLITIPLPPKEKSMESQKEWPQVGGEVLICKNANLLGLHRFNGKQCKVIGICEHDNKKVLTLSHKSCGLAAMNMGEWIKKPPTPVEKLDAKLYDFFQCNSTEDLAEAIINGEIEGLEYKPQ